MKNAKFLLKKYSPLILTSLGSVGVVVTSVLTAKATVKAKDLIEKVEESENCKLTLKACLHVVRLSPYSSLENQGFCAFVTFLM